MHKILLVQGANMSRLGKRNPEAYGHMTAAQLDAMLIAQAKGLGMALETFYTHIEGEAIGRIYDAVDNGGAGLLMNPAGFSHAGYALRDCLRELPFPYIEIHARNAVGRGHRSVTCECAHGYIAGFGPDTYVLALEAMKRLLDAPKRATTQSRS